MAYIQPQEAIFNTSFEQILKDHNDRTLVQPKEDGYRFQIHRTKDGITAYTKSGKVAPFVIYPEVYNSVHKLPPCILDCELVGLSRKNALAFESIQKRYRARISDVQTYMDSGLVAAHPLKLVVFDAMKWEKKNLLQEPFETREQYTAKIAEKNIFAAHTTTIRDARSLESLFESTVANGGEGLMCKDPQATYGQRGAWYKLKRFETIDAVIVGVYEQDGLPGQALCAVRNGKELQTIGIVNLKREDFAQKLAYLKDTKVGDVDALELNDSLVATHAPTYFVKPTTVLELRALNISYGKNLHSCSMYNGESYSLRIGHVHRLRPDKNATQINTTHDVVMAYKRERGEA
ncbi:MAG TPA: hypothetical protein VK158_06130 [Acidobacteriota bacterium]|nr:hypothetical protein [Acidobacteriota bacterium]